MSGNYGFWLPVAASSYARDLDTDFYLLLSGMVLMFFLWLGAFVYFLLRYRSGRAHQVERSGRGGGWALGAGLSIIVFELAVIVVYSVPTWAHVRMWLPSEKDAVEVEVKAQQYAWNVRYPGPDGKFGRTDPKLVHFTNPIGLDFSDPAAKDDVVLANEIHLPLGRPAIIRLSSLDVIHSLFIPEFRLKQDAVPGMSIPLWVKPTRLGTYDMVCAQLCGFAHAFMDGKVIVESPEAFEAWLKSRAPAAPTPAANF